MRDALPDRCVAFLAGWPQGPLREMRARLVSGRPGDRGRSADRQRARHGPPGRPICGCPAESPRAAGVPVLAGTTAGTRLAARASRTWARLGRTGAGRAGDGLVDGALPREHRDPVAAIV